MTVKFQKLNRINMRALQPEEKLSEHGIEFMRLSNGDGRFTINIMVDGKRIHRVVGKESEGVTCQQALDLIAQIRQKSRENRLKLPKGRKLAMSLEQAAEHYLERLIHENGKDIPAKKRRLNQHLLPFFKDRLLSDISTFDIERYKKNRLTQGAKPATINRELANLSHLFSKALDWHWIDAKPCQLKKLKEENRRITYLTIDQIQRILECAKQNRSPHIYAFIMIAVATSMRRMEILSIRIDNIDLDRHIIYVPKAKAGAREQPITAGLASFLKEYLTPARLSRTWLFPSINSVTGHVMNIEKPFRSVIKAAGLDPKEVVRHTLRHTAITHLVQAGVDLPTVQRISGHKSLEMVMRYSHQNGDHIRSAMDALEQRYGEATKS